MSLTAEQVLALAPDASAATAGRKLGVRKPWRALGRSVRALWGECQGSAVYQVRIDLSDLGTKCSCPSRKFPCKHALGLLFLEAAEAAALPEESEPEWVAEWLAKRGEAAVLRETKKEARPAAEADPKAREERAEKRLERIARGIEGLDLWLEDLVRNGLATAEGQPSAFWERQAARLVDAQAPGLAARVRRLADIPGGGADWPETLLGEIGRLALLTHAFGRLDALEPPLREDVRRLVGLPLSQEEVAASGEKVTDRWLVLGQVTENEERVRSQRTWLLGETSGRAALLLQFAVGEAAFPALFAPGSRFEADLAFWPSAWPQRALVVERRADTGPAAADAPWTESIESFLSQTADALARQPWLDRFPCALRGVVPAPAAAAEGSSRFRLLDRDGGELPLAVVAGVDPWRLLALSGGHPLDLTGEWDGAALIPLGAFVRGEFHPLGRRA